jgi:hypothetical protein
MVDGRIEIECECGGIFESDFSDHSEPWNESPRYIAKCGECGRTVKFWIQADEPEPKAAEAGHE